MKKLFSLLTFLTMTVSFLNAQGINELSSYKLQSNISTVSKNSMSLLTLTAPSFSSQNNISNINYGKKSRNQKTAAWVLLGGGFAMVTTGILLAATKVTTDFISVFFLEPQSSNYTGENILIIAGSASMLSSIPLFVASAKNKRRAMLEIKDQKTAFGLPIATGKNITGLTLAIPIGK